MSEYLVIDVHTYTGSDSEYSTITLFRTHCLPTPINNSTFKSNMKTKSESMTYSGLQYDLIEYPLRSITSSYKYINNGHYLYFSCSGYDIDTDSNGSYNDYTWKSSNEYTGHGSTLTVRGLAYLCWNKQSYNGSSSSIYTRYTNLCTNDFLKKYPSIKDDGTEVWEYTGWFKTGSPHLCGSSMIPKYSIELAKGSNQINCSSDFNSISIYIRPLIVIDQKTLTDVYKKNS